MIVPCEEKDLSEIYEIINDGAAAYKGIIPADQWHEPYMTLNELRNQIDQGVQFWCYMVDNKMVGVMGIQPKENITLIRHAYVRTIERNKGIGGKLLQHLRGISHKPILIGTWADAGWAIEFYKKHGFHLVSTEQKDTLLQKYWSISTRQKETSVVLASSDWHREN